MHNTKYCNKCKKDLSVDCFYSDKSTKDGLHYYCKECLKISHKLYNDKNKISLSKKKKDYYNLNKNKFREYYKTNKKRINSNNKNWMKENRDYRKEYDRLYKSNKRKNDEEYKLKIKLRNKLKKILIIRNIKKKNKTKDLIGCSLSELKLHLESKFQHGMSWNNYGEWHIDHIKPCASFDLTDTEQQKQCFHYTNLQPLWGRENESKGSLYEGKRHRTNKYIKE